MMGVPNNNSNSNATVEAPQSPAIPQFEDIPSSPIAAQSGDTHSEFGTPPPKSYTAAFPRTPGSASKNSATLEAPGSRLRHNITMRKAAASSATKSGPSTPKKMAANAGSDVENLSFDMGEVEMLGSAENLPQAATPFSRTGQANFVTLREQEKVMDEIKKENFDLKLRVSLLQERLARLTPENIESALSENVELKVKNEALMSENKTYKNLVNEAHSLVEQMRLEQAQRRQDSVDVVEVNTLRTELDQTRHALTKAQVSVQRYESQMSLFDKESRENASRVKQLELDLHSAQNRLADANATIARQKAEIAALEEELATKSETMRKFREDISASTSDISLFTRQMQELQDRLKRSEEEKEGLMREKDAIRKSLEKAESQIRVTNTISSPVRNSLDVLESKLLKELGQAHKRVTDLEKQTNLSQEEREALLIQARKATQDLTIGVKSLQLLAGKIVEVAFPGKVLPDNVDGIVMAVEQVEVLCRDVLVELEESRLNVRDLESQIARANENLTSAIKERDDLSTSLSAAEVQVQKLSLDLSAKTSELRQAAETTRSLQARIRDMSEQDVPKWQREAEKATERVRQLTQFVENYQSQLQATQVENEELSKKYAEVQQMAVRAQSELADVRDSAQRAVKQRDEFVERLAQQEAIAASATKRLEELQNRVGHSEKVKSAVEEQFNRELKALHAANGELKGQLSVAQAARSELTQRVDRLSQLLREAERSSEDLIERARSSESHLSALRREHEILLLEHKTVEGELADKQAALGRLEAELSKMRREDLVARRTTDGLEHLQAKVDSLTAMNSFLKDQTETRERTIRALEDRLRHQQEEMRHAREEVDAQARKLKKRELLISQALKRLESINHMRQVAAAGGVSAMTGVDLTASPFRDDHHPSLTPTRPTKRPTTSMDEF